VLQKHLPKWKEEKNVSSTFGAQLVSLKSL